MKQDVAVDNLTEEEEQALSDWPGEHDAPLHHLILPDLLAPSLVARLSAVVPLARTSPPTQGRAWRKVPWSRH